MKRFEISVDNFPKTAFSRCFSADQFPKMIPVNVCVIFPFRPPMHLFLVSDLAEFTKL